MVRNDSLSCLCVLDFLKEPPTACYLVPCVLVLMKQLFCYFWHLSERGEFLKGQKVPVLLLEPCLVKFLLLGQVFPVLPGSFFSQPGGFSASHANRILRKPCQFTPAAEGLHFCTSCFPFYTLTFLPFCSCLPSYIHIQPFTSVHCYLYTADIFPLTLWQFPSPLSQQ